MTLQPAVAAVQQGNGIAQQEVTVRLSQSNPAAEAEAREILRTIHNTIIVFRDDRWDGLVRARNRLVRTTLYTGVFTFVLLGVTIVVGAPLAAIEAAALFYLVGVIFGGLIIRLYLDSTNDSAVEDYGLATVRLVQTSLLSGLAAIGGVVLTGAFPTDGQSATITNLIDIFSFKHLSVTLPLAAVFGLSPGLLVSRIGRQVDQYKADISSSKVTSSK